MNFILNKVEEVVDNEGRVVFVHHFGLDQRVNQNDTKCLAGIIQIMATERLPIKIGEHYDTPKL